MNWRPIRAHESSPCARSSRAKAFAHTAQYDAMVSAYFTGAIGGAAPTFPDDLNLSFRKHLDLRYGENPHQQAAFYTDPRAIGASVTQARQIQGKELSYNNIADSRYGARMRASIRHRRLRHRQACQSLRRGALPAASPTPMRSPIAPIPPPRMAASSPSIANWMRRRRSAIIEQQFVEVILAPSVSDDAKAVLAPKDNVRVLVIGDLSRAGDAVARIQERGRRPAGANARLPAWSGPRNCAPSPSASRPSPSSMI